MAGRYPDETHNIGTVLVTGAHGRVGKACIAFLAQSGRCTVRATTRDLSKADYLKGCGAHEVVELDLTKQDTWEQAVEGCTAVFSSSMDSLISEHIQFSKFLGTKKDAIKHVVRISCFGADTNTNSYDKQSHVTRGGAEIPLMLQHYWWSEESLIDAGLAVTSIRGNFYMNHLLKNEAENIKQKGYFATCLGDMRNSFVCSNDMGEVAAAVLLQGPERHADRYYDITGPTPQSMYEVAADLSVAINSKVEYRPQDIAQFEKDFGPTRAAFFEYLQNGFYARCSPDFYNLMGRKPTSYLAYLQQKGPFGETGVEELFSASGSIYTKGVDNFKHLAAVSKL